MALGNALLQALGGSPYKPEENPFGIAGQAIAQGAPYITNPYGSAGKNALYTIGAGLLAGLLGGVARKQTESDNAAQMRAWNTAVQDPTAREAIAAQNPRLASAINALQMDEQQRQAESQQRLADQMQAAQIDVWKRGQIIPMEQQAKVDEMTALAPIEASRARQIKEAEIIAARAGLAPFGDGDRGAQQIPETQSSAPRDAEGAWLDMVNKEAQRLIASGAATPATAMEAAAKGLQPKLDILKRQYSRAEDSEKTARDLNSLADQMESAFNEAGYTGFGGQALHSLSGLAGVASADQEAKYAAGEKLKSFGGKIISIVKPKGTGAMSDPEMLMWLKGGIDVTTPKTTGQDIANRWRYAAALERNYADFVREQTSRGVNSSEIERRWNKVVDANPYLFKDSKGNFSPNTAWQTGRLIQPGEPAPTSGQIEKPRLGTEAPSARNQQALIALARNFDNSPEGRAAFKQAAQAQGLQ